MIVVFFYWGKLDNGSAIIYKQAEESLLIGSGGRIVFDGTFLRAVLRQRKENRPSPRVKTASRHGTAYSQARKHCFFTGRTFHACGSIVFLLDGPSTRVEVLFFYLTDLPRAWKL